MADYLLAVCDSDRVYAEKFMTYANRKRSAPFEVHAFSGAKPLASFLRRHPACIVLADAALITEEILVLAGPNLIVLDGGDTPELLREDAEGAAAALPHIAKFQSAPAILREVMRICSDTEMKSTAAALKQTASLIGVYAPAGGSGASVFAACAAQLLGLSHTTLLVSLEENAGLSALLKTEFPEDLSNGIYYIRRGDAQFMFRILPLAQRLGSCDFLPPFRSAADLRSVTRREWEILLSALKESAGYEAVVIDFGTLPAAAPNLLSLCGRLFIPVRRDVAGAAKLAAFRTENPLLFAAEGPARTADLCGLAVPTGTDRFFEQLPYSAFGSAVRSLLEKEALL